MARRNYDSSIIEIQRFDDCSALVNSVPSFAGEKWDAWVRPGNYTRSLYCYGPTIALFQANPNQIPLATSLKLQDKPHHEPTTINLYNNGHGIEFYYPIYEWMPNYCKRTPKWGWRSAHIDCEAKHTTTNMTGIWTFTGEEKELEFWVRPGVTIYWPNDDKYDDTDKEDDNAGRIFAFLKNANEYGDGGEALFECSRGADGKMTIKDSSKTFTPTIGLPKGEWSHLRFQFYGKNLTVWVNGVNAGTGEILGEYAPAEVRWGPGMDGEIDEIVLRNKLTDSATCTVVPNHPYLAVTDIKALGGYGDRKLGNVNITQSCKINSYAAIVSASGSKVTIGGWTTGIFGEPEIGDEVMIRVGGMRLPSDFPANADAQQEYIAEGNSDVYTLYADYKDAGKFAFRKITATNGSIIELDSPVTEEFNLETLAQSSFVQLITVPNFSTLTIGSNAVITPIKLKESEDFAGGGIVAFRTRGDCTIDGKIITLGYGAPRYDRMLYGYEILPDQFLMCGGGGVFAVCGGTFKASHNARIGAEWDGASGMAEGGALTERANNGGAGYGGASGGLTYNTLKVHGKKSVTRNGGNGENSYYWWVQGGLRDEYYPEHSASYENYMTWGSFALGCIFAGYDQLPPPCSASYRTQKRAFLWDYKMSAWHEDAAVYGGASVLIACRTLSVDKSAISTGGQGGYEWPETYHAYYHEHRFSLSGGGAGLCYITAKEMI